MCKRGLLECKLCLNRPTSRTIFAVISVIFGILTITLSLMVLGDIHARVTFFINANAMAYSPQTTEAAAVTGTFQAICSLLLLTHIQSFKSWRWTHLTIAVITAICFVITVIDIDVLDGLTLFYNYYISVLFFNCLFSALSFILFRMRDEQDSRSPPIVLAKL